MSLLRKNADLFFIFIITFLIYFCTKNQPFFWDNISQVSVPALHIFKTHFTEIYPPDTVATGHQPFVAFWVALGWELFGKNLQVSHTMMIPGVFLGLYYLWKIISECTISLTYKIWIFILVAGESVFISQMSLLSFEVFHIAFFLGCVYSIIKKNYIGLLLLGMALHMVSLRASISGIGLLLFALYSYFQDRSNANAKTLLSLVPGIFVLALFLLHFYSVKSWIIHNTVSDNWSQSSKAADFSLILRNSIVFFWRLVDNGKIGILLLFCCIIFSIKGTKGTFLEYNLAKLVGITVFQALVFYGVTVSSQNSFNNRYILPVSVLLLLILLVLIVQNFGRATTMLWISSICILSGHFWIYPKNSANSWDSLLITRIVFSQMEDANQYVKKEGIPKNKIGTSFPWKAEEEKKYLIPEKHNYVNIDTQNNEYILLSNTCNPSELLLQELKNKGKWKMMYKNETYFTWVKMYHRVKQ